MVSGRDVVVRWGSVIRLPLSFSLLVSWHRCGGDDQWCMGVLLGSGSSRRWRLVERSTANSRPVHRHSAPREPPERPQRSPECRSAREPPASIKNSLSGRLGGSRGHHGRVYRPNLSPNSHPAVIWRPFSRPSGDHFALLLILDPRRHRFRVDLTRRENGPAKGQKDRERIENGLETDLGEAGERPVRVRGEGRIRRCLDGRLRSPTQRR